MNARALLVLTLGVSLGVPSLSRAQPAGRVIGQGLAASVAAGQYPRRGDRGAAVRELQARLGQRGQAVAVDGDFGPETDGAVRALQRAHGLAADGVVGPDTLAVLQGGSAPVSRPGSVVEVLGGEPAARPPAASTPPEQVRAAALPWARAARAAARHELIVVFEGLWAYSPAYAQRIYGYQEALRAGRAPARPAASGLSFVSRELIVPNLPATLARAELLLLPETSENGETSVGEQACRAWSEVHGAEARLVIVGHSFGGWSSLRLARKLEARGIPVAGVLTVDARSLPQNYRRFITPANVREHWNYFQKGPWMPGYAIDGAHNQRLRVSHGGIPGAPEVVATYLRLVR